MLTYIPLLWLQVYLTGVNVKLIRKGSFNDIFNGLNLTSTSTDFILFAFKHYKKLKSKQVIELCMFKSSLWGKLITLHNNSTWSDCFSRWNESDLSASIALCSAESKCGIQLKLKRPALTVLLPHSNDCYCSSTGKNSPLTLSEKVFEKFRPPAFP